MSRATEAQLDLLHGLLSSALQSELETAMKASKDKGEPINPQLLDKVMKFLGQNGVDTPAQSERKDHLAATLADLDLDEEALSPRH